MENGINNFFDVLGTDEPGCTRSLAAFIAQKPALLNSLNVFFKNKIPVKDLNEMKISAEYSEGNSRNDILCISTDFCIIIEAKIKSNIVSYEQIKKYIKQLQKKNQKHKHLILLTQYKNQIVSQELSYEAAKYNITISTTLWADFLKYINKNKANFNVNLADNFQNYITRSVKMKVYDKEILAVVVRDENIHLFEHGYYRQNNIYSPVFIARREPIAGRSAFDKIYPMKDVLLFENPKDRKKIDSIYKKLNIEKNTETVLYVFDIEHPIELKKPSTYKFTHIANSCIEIPFSKIYE